METVETQKCKFKIIAYCGDCEDCRNTKVQVQDYSIFICFWCSMDIYGGHIYICQLH